MANKNVGSPKKAKSRILESVHEDAKGLFAAGAIDKTTMREFDVLCLPNVLNHTAKQIKSTRMRCNASQTVFAAYMNIFTLLLAEIGIRSKKTDRCRAKTFEHHR